MIKRTVEISQSSVHLSVRLDQLIVQPHEESAGRAASIPCEDIGVVLIDNQRTTYSHAALAQLVKFDAVVIVCGRNHLPAGLLLPLSNHSRVVWRIHDQLAISKPLRKQLWKQIVQAKVNAQAMNLSESTPERNRLLAMVKEVRSNDAGNIEAQAARLYWQHWLGSDSSFRRDTSTEAAAPNNLLNYGYAVIRATLARAIVAAGFLPALGLHHRNRSNAFCLADDLIEPLRPIVDRRVRELYCHHNRTKLDQPTKAGILQVLTTTVKMEDQTPTTGPLFVAIQRMVGSLVRCYQGKAKSLTIPAMIEDHQCSSQGTEACGS